MKLGLALLGLNGLAAVAVSGVMALPAVEAVSQRAEGAISTASIAPQVPTASAMPDPQLAAIRRLFGSSRVDSVPAPQSPSAPATQPKSLPLLKLIGVLVGDESRIALVRIGEPPETRRVVLGGAVGKWQVVRIDPRSVVLREGVQEMEIKLDPEATKP